MALIGLVCVLGASAQNFCSLHFGVGWASYEGGIIDNNVSCMPDYVSERYPVDDSVYQVLRQDSLFFCQDSIHFVRASSHSRYDFLKLECLDSTYALCTLSGMELLNENGYIDTVYMISTINSQEGHWGFKDSLLRFKPIWSAEWFIFKMENIGTKETNKKIIWTSTGDYRTEIRLVRIHEEE